MDLGLILVIAAVVFLVGHLLLDLRTLAKNLRGLRHSEYAHDRQDVLECELCHTKLRGPRELRHEALWTAAAVVVLSVHIVLDFVG